MPRTAGVSASSTVWLIFFSPSPRTVSRWRCLMPASPFTRRTLSLFTEDFLDLLAAARRDLRGRAHRLQAVAALFRLLHPWLDFRHKSPGTCPLEFKSGGARRLSERLHASMVFIAGAVESNLLDPLFLPLDGDALADDLGGLAVAAVLHLGPDVLLQRGGARNDLVA